MPCRLALELRGGIPQTASQPAHSDLAMTRASPTYTALLPFLVDCPMFWPGRGFPWPELLLASPVLQTLLHKSARAACERARVYCSALDTTSHLLQRNGVHLPDHHDSA